MPNHHNMRNRNSKIVKNLSNKQKIMWQMKLPNLLHKGSFYLQYCHLCKRDNFIPDIKYGKCAWCDWNYYEEIKEGVRR